MEANSSAASIIHSFQEDHPILSSPIEIIQQPLLLINQAVKIGFFLGYKVAAASAIVIGATLGAIYGLGITVLNLFRNNAENQFTFRPIHDYAIKLSRTLSESTLIPKLVAGVVGGAAITAFTLPVLISPYFWGTLACAVPASIIDATINGKPKYTRKVLDGVWKYSDPYTYFNTPVDDHEGLKKFQKPLSPYTGQTKKIDKAEKSEPLKTESSPPVESQSAITVKPTSNITIEENFREKPDYSSHYSSTPDLLDETIELQIQPPATRLIHNTFRPDEVPEREDLPSYVPRPDANWFCTLAQKPYPKDAVVLCSESGHEDLFSYKRLKKMFELQIKKGLVPCNPNTRQPFTWNDVYRVRAPIIREKIKEEESLNVT